MTTQKRKSLLWIGDIGRYTSFSRITQSVVPLLSEDLDITILAPPLNLITDKKWTSPDNKYKIIHVGDSIPSINFTWDQFKSSFNNQCTDISLKMKYALFQAVYTCKEKKIDYIMFVIGIFEAEWFYKIYNSIKSLTPYTKSIVWTPLDYKPTVKVIENIMLCDYIFTMTPVMRDIIKGLIPNNITSRVYSIPHAVSNTLNKENTSRHDSIKFIYELKGVVWNGITQNCKISEKDFEDKLFILNANNFIKRKQFDLTLDSFVKLSLKNPNVILWLHTNINNVDFTKLLNIYLDKYPEIMEKIILSNNNLNDSQLMNVYKTCQIGLQTSWGEGWSLTNCEHAMLDGVQIVPDFLATGYNFNCVKSTGTLYPVNEIEYKNEDNKDVYIGKGKVCDIVRSLEKGIEIVRNDKLLRDYQGMVKNNLSKNSWKNISNQIKDIIS
jgi:hypothetical protein